MEDKLHFELGERAARALIMENTGPLRRRVGWIVSSAVLSVSVPQTSVHFAT